ncbi:MAG: hypothetical protein Q9170_005542 [Blastenia crenularia]
MATASWEDLLDSDELLYAYETPMLPVDSTSHLADDEEVEPFDPFPRLPRQPSSPSPNAAITSSNLAQSKFLSLPTEIRLKIYSFCLVSSSKIVVWSAMYPSPRNHNAPNKLQFDRDAMSRSTRSLALGLLRCCTTVAAESAHVFYHNNMFRFYGDHEYYPVITWLDRISDNRDSLENLEITVRRPHKAWQLPDGSRHEEVFQEYRGSSLHHPHFSRPMGLYQEGEVDIIDPAVETIISLLAKSRSRGNMTLYLDTNPHQGINIPGIELFVEEDTSQFSMDLPNLLEIWRTSYFSGNSGASLDIVWKAEANPDLFHDKRSMIEDLGWKIFNEQKGSRIYNPYRRPGKDVIYPTIRFSMRRGQLTFPIMAADPDPYTDEYRCPFG